MSWIFCRLPKVTIFVAIPNNCKVMLLFNITFLFQLLHFMLSHRQPLAVNELIYSSPDLEIFFWFRNKNQKTFLLGLLFKVSQPQAVSESILHCSHSFFVFMHFPACLSVPTLRGVIISSSLRHEISWVKLRKRKEPY